MGSGEKTPLEWTASGSLGDSHPLSGPSLFPHLVPSPCTYPESLCPAAEAWPHPKPA